MYPHGQTHRTYPQARTSSTPHFSRPDGPNKTFFEAGGLVNTKVPRTPKLTLTLTPTQGTREPSGKGGAGYPLGILCVGRAQIDAQTSILNEGPSWTSWVCCSRAPEDRFSHNIRSTSNRVQRGGRTVRARSTQARAAPQPTQSCKDERPTPSGKSSGSCTHYRIPLF